MSAERRTKQIKLTQLTPGMYVVELDIPWIDSPFFKHNRLIKSNQDIVKLRQAGVETLVIDLAKGLSPADEADKRDKSAFAQASPAQGANGSAKTAESHLDPVKSLEKEMNLAYELRSQIKNSINKINAKLERNLPIDSEAFVPLIDDTLRSLERNHQALLNLAHLSRRSQKLIDHAFSTFCLCLTLAREMDLSKEDIDTLGLAALLHDSGWLQLPLHLMGKRSAYTATEKKLVRSHVDIGLKTLKSSALPDPVIRVISEHQEMSDGSGYPKGLKAEETHALSKILRVVDRYDECVHQLADKPGMLPTNALRLLYQEAEQGKLEANLVAGLINILGIYPVTSAVQLNTGEKGVVEQVFADAHLEPVLRIFYGSDNRLLDESIVVDLRKTDQVGRFIASVIDPSDPKVDPERKLMPVFSE